MHHLVGVLCACKVLNQCLNVYSGYISDAWRRINNLDTSSICHHWFSWWSWGGKVKIWPHQLRRMTKILNPSHPHCNDSVKTKMHLMYSIRSFSVKSKTPKAPSSIWIVWSKKLNEKFFFIESNHHSINRRSTLCTLHIYSIHVAFYMQKIRIHWCKHTKLSQAQPEPHRI